MSGRLSAQIHAALEPPYRFAIYDAHPYGKPGLPELTLAVQSVRAYPTLQYRIRADLFIEGNTVTLQLREILNDSQIQQRAMGPATYSTALPIGTGTYDLVFATPSAQDRYRVRIAEDAIDVRGSAGTLTIPPPRLYRIPRNSAYVRCTPAGFDDHVCNDFFKLASIRARASIAGAIPPLRPNPFFYPLPMGQVDDLLPSVIYVGVDSAAWLVLVRFTEDYTRIFQYAQYTLVVGLYNWDGATAQCYSGVCHGKEP
jgi:hypothetical protein